MKRTWMGNLQNVEIDWEDLKYSNDDSEIENYKLHPNTLFFNWTNSPEIVGKVLIDRGTTPAVFEEYLIRVNLNKWINAYII